MDLPDDGLVLVLKEACPTCRLIAPVAAELARRGDLKAVYSQDDPAFPEGLAVRDDRGLEASFALDAEIVPTLVRRDGGRETGRAVGWSRDEWRALTGVDGIGGDLPDERPGCGSLSVEPGVAEELLARYGDTGLESRRVGVAFPEDPFERMFDLGWTDGLPVVPPTPARVLGMLRGAERGAAEIVGFVPPSGHPCTVEKAAVAAVMAGCRPDYFPVVLAALDAALDPAFAWQGLLSTTMGAGVCVVANGPVARRIGVNGGLNALGHGARANSTIPRALLLTAMNVGGAKPGGVDRSTLGHPGKRGLCFAEDDSDPAWPPLARSRGVPEGASAVTLFGFCGTVVANEETAREPDAVTSRIALSLDALDRPGRAGGMGAMVVIGGEFWRVYREAGWDRARIEAALRQATERPGSDGRRRRADGDAGRPGEDGIARFAPGDLLVVRAGGAAGLFAAIIQGWGSGPGGSQPVTREVKA